MEHDWMTASFGQTGTMVLRRDVSMDEEKVGDR